MRFWMALAVLTLTTAHAQTKPLTCHGFQASVTGDTGPVEVRGPGGFHLTFDGRLVTSNGCGDITGDGKPDWLLHISTGGNHCCTTNVVLSLQPTPRILMNIPNANGGPVFPVQLDGTPEKELVTSDDRFAYVLDLSYAESPSLPTFYRLEDGQYVNATRAYPEAVKRWLMDGWSPFLPAGHPNKPRDSTPRNAPVHNQTTLQGAMVQHALGSVFGKSILPSDPTPSTPHPWLDLHKPAVAQLMQDYGLEDTPIRAGLPRQNWTGVGSAGSFVKASSKDYVAAIDHFAEDPSSKDEGPFGVKSGHVGLVLFSWQNGKWVGGKAFIQRPAQGKGHLSLVPFWTLPRAGGGMDLLVWVEDETGGGQFEVFTHQNGVFQPGDDSLSPYAPLTLPLTYLVHVRAEGAGHDVQGLKAKQTLLQATYGGNVPLDDLDFSEFHHWEHTPSGTGGTLKVTLDIIRKSTGKSELAVMDLQYLREGNRWVLSRWDLKTFPSPARK